MSEKTLVLIKPDGVKRGLVGDIIGRYEKKGYRIVAAKLIKPDVDLVKTHYSEHINKKFFNNLVNYIMSGEIFAMILEGKNVIANTRKINGTTDPLTADIGTIRGDFAVSLTENIVHGSDCSESAKREIALWFPEYTE